MDITELTPRQLRHAADLKERIDTLQEQLNQLLGLQAPAVQTPKVPKNGRKKRKQLSPEGRANLRAAAKARWARIKGAKGAAEPQPPALKPMRKMTAAWKQALSLAREARMAKLRAAKSSAKPEPKPKRYISPALRMARSEALKARWAKAKRAGKANL